MAAEDKKLKETIHMEISRATFERKPDGFWYVHEWTDDGKLWTTHGPYDTYQEAVDAAMGSW